MTNTIKKQVWLCMDGVHQHAYNILQVMSDKTLLVQPEGAETTYWLYLRYPYGVLENEKTHEIKRGYITSPFYV